MAGIATKEAMAAQIKHLCGHDAVLKQVADKKRDRKSVKRFSDKSRDLTKSATGKV
jgi:hypothetical protein